MRQVPITYRTRPDMTRPWLAGARLAIAVLCTVLFVSGWVCAAATPQEFSRRLTNSIQACNASGEPHGQLPRPANWDVRWGISSKLFV